MWAKNDEKNSHWYEWKIKEKLFYFEKEEEEEAEEEKNRILNNDFHSWQCKRKREEKGAKIYMLLPLFYHLIIMKIK